MKLRHSIPIGAPASELSSLSTDATDPCVAQENGVGKNHEALSKLTAQRTCSAVREYGGAPDPRNLGRNAQRRTNAPRLTALLALALSACATPTITRSCLTQKQYEQLKASEPPKVHDKLTGKADEDVRPLAGSALELRAWGHAMLDTLKICSTP